MEDNKTDRGVSSLHSWVITVSLLIIPLLLKPGIIENSNLPKEFGIGLAVSALLLLGGANLVFGNGRALIRLPSSLLTSLVIGSVIIFLLYGLVSQVWVTNPSLHSSHWNLWLIAVLPFLFIQFTKFDENQLRRILFGLVIGASANAAGGLIQFWFGLQFEFQTAFPAGFFMNKNFAASYSVLALPVSFILWQTSSRLPRYLAAAAFLVLSLFIFHVFSRASWVAAFASLLFVIPLYGYVRWLSHQRVGSRRLVEVAIVFSLFLFGTFWGESGFGSRGSDAFERITKSSVFREAEANETLDGAKHVESDSWRDRLLFWENILLLAQEKLPFGVGEGNFAIEFPPYARSANITQYDTIRSRLSYAHNEYLELIVEYGFLGLLLIVCLGFCILVLVIKTIRDLVCSRGKIASWASIAGLGSVLGFSINILASSPLYWPAHRYAFLILLAIAFHSRVSSNKSIAMPARIGGGLLLLLGAVLLVGSVRSYASESKAQRYYKEAGKLYFHGQKADALQLLLDSHELSRANYFINYQLADLYFHTNRIESGLPYMEFLSIQYPYDYRNNKNLSDSYLRTGRREEALPVFERMYQVNETNPDAVAKLALLIRDSDSRRSNQLLRDITMLDDCPPIIYILLSENYILQGNRSEALEVISLGRTRFPSSNELSAFARRLKD